MPQVKLWLVFRSASFASYTHTFVPVLKKKGGYKTNFLKKILTVKFFVLFFFTI